MPIEQGFTRDQPISDMSPQTSVPSRQAFRRRTRSTAAVNGFRGPGAIAIVLAHVGLATDAIPHRHVLPLALMVDLFFVLSGLVIAQAYAAKLSQRSNIPEYVIRRFGRIWPMQAVTLAVLVSYELLKVIIAASGHGHLTSPAFSRDGNALVEAIPTNLFLIQSFGLHDRWTWNYPSWSLSVEFVTYVAFALSCLMAPRVRRLVSLATIVASIAILVIVAPYGMFSTFDYGIFRCLAGFFAGTLCYEAVERWPMPRVRYPSLLEFAAVAFVGFWLSVSYRSWVGYAAPVVFGLFLLVFLGEGGLVSRLLKSRVMQVLADLSFSIYMVHALVLIAILAVVHATSRFGGVALFRSVANPFADLPGAHATVEVLHVGGIGEALLLLSVYLGGVAVATLAAYRFVEVPGRDLFNRLAKRLTKLALRSRSGSDLGSLERSP